MDIYIYTIRLNSRTTPNQKGEDQTNTYIYTKGEVQTDTYIYTCTKGEDQTDTYIYYNIEQHDPRKQRGKIRRTNIYIL
jgi:hypothetical protein